MSRSIIVVSAALAMLAMASSAPADPFVRLDDYDDPELMVTGFELARPVKATIEAVGVESDRVRRWSWSNRDDRDRDRDADKYDDRSDSGDSTRDDRDARRSWRHSWGFDDDDRGPLATAWLIDSATRKVVWSQDASRNKRDDGDRASDRRRNRDRDRDDDDLDPSVTRVEDVVDLPAGRYELYAWAGGNWGGGIQIFGLRNFVGSSRHGGWSSNRLRRAFRDCYVQISADGMRESDAPRFQPTGEIPGALYRATGVGDEAFVRAGFRVDRPLSVRVYALGEMPRDWREPADGGWIVNADTRERVWQLRERDLEDAGGASKNRVHDRDVELQPGRYELCYGTDASHSPEEWNAAPPHDALNWGVTLLPGKNFDASAFHVEGDVSRGEPVVDLTRARDDDSLEKGFTLARETDVQIYAIGEWNDGADEFADSGWITDARSGRVVWEMTERNTTAAGGAEKNRMFDGVVRLPAGDYIARFDTDDSHAYRDWNSDPPWDRNAWGLSLYTAPGSSSADFKVSDVSSAEMSRLSRGDALVSMVRVRDDEHRRERFELDADTRVHIRAVGEGQDGALYDYAWIEDDRTGRVVWEMTWRNTRHAGGARKNRIFEDEVRLDAGSYEVHYVTDDSHSYRRWNAGKPRDPDAWGITISRADR